MLSTEVQLVESGEEEQAQAWRELFRDSIFLLYWYKRTCFTSTNTDAGDLASGRGSLEGVCLQLPATRCAVYLFYSVYLLYLCCTSVRSMPAAARNEELILLALLVLDYCFTSTNGQILTQKTSQSGVGSCGLLASSRSRMLTYTDVC